MHHRTLLLGTLLAATMLTPARADTVTASQAQQVQQQIEAWLTGAFGTPPQKDDHPILVSAEEDHYRLQVPFKGVSTGPAPLALTMAARPLDQGRWAVEHMSLSLPAQFTIKQTVPASDDAPPPKKLAPGAKPPPAAAKPAPQTVAINYKVTAKSQDGSGMWDPSFRTASTFTQDMAGLHIEAEGPGLHRVTDIAQSHGVTVMQPADNSRTDVTMEGSVEGFSQETNAGDVAVRVGIGKGRVSGSLTGVQRDQMATLVKALVQTGQKNAALPADARNAAGARVLFDGMRGLADAFTLDETLDGVSLVAGGREFGATTGKVGLSMQSVKGLADFTMSIAMQGITSAQPGPFDAFIPSVVTLRPHVTGLTSKEVLDYLSALTEPAADKDALAQGMVTRGGLEAGLDSFEIVLGRTNLSGTTTAHFNQGGAPRITAEVTAINFDDLSATASKTPFAAQATPVLLLVKGLGRTSGDKLSWSVVSENGHTTVNGTDLSALTGGVR